MSRELSCEENYILDLIRDSVTNEFDSDERILARADIDTDKLIEISRAHAITSLLYTATEQLALPQKLVEIIEKEAKTVTYKNYRLLLLSRAIQNTLKDHNIKNVILKGSATASLYPIPEYRKSGDVDLLIFDESKLDEACHILEDLGLVCNEVQRALHHVSFTLNEGIEVELHTLLAEPFDNKEINNYLMEVTKKCESETIDVCGVEIEVLTTAYNAFELLLHMLQHFLRAGFGLKLLCDWVVFWNRDIADSEKELYIKLVEESRIKGFSDMVTQTCVDYLGLCKDKVDFMKMKDIDTSDFVTEIFDAEEFGHSSNDRMVGMRGAGLTDYIREFHHQTCLNFPKVSKIIIAMPILWLITLIKFMINNKNIRHVSTADVLKKAQGRGKLIKGLNLFK